MRKFFYSCICIVALICSSCETDAPSLRAVITGDATEMNSNSVVLHGIINGNPREYSHLKCGFMIATSHFDIVNRKKQNNFFHILYILLLLFATGTDSF